MASSASNSTPTLITLEYRVSVDIINVRQGIMRLHKYYPDKQQYNNAKPFTVYVVAIEEVENYCTAGFICKVLIYANFARC